MKSKLTKIFACAAMALALVGCESRQDIDRKPDIVKSMVENSASICERGPVNGDPALYKQRLSKVLMGAYTHNLETLQKNNVTVCLDQRLPHQARGFWDSYMDGVYYSKTPAGAIVSFADNGLQPAETGFFTGNPAYYRGSEAIDVLARKIADGKAPAAGAKMYAGETGKHHHIYWTTSFDKDTIVKNPQLQSPPLRP